ncbi:hypothetical protein ABPG75_011288 [Micractinium tetrahymenae]
MDPPNAAQQRTGVGDLPDVLLAHIFALAGHSERQCALVCRRWWRVWWSSLELWRRFRTVAFDGQPDREDCNGYLSALLAVLQRMGQLVEEADLRGTGAMQWQADDAGLPWRLADALGCLSPRRLRCLRLWSECAAAGTWLLNIPAMSGLHTYPSLPATAARRIGRFRRLESLELSSWQLPASLVPALGRLTALRALSLRTRQLPAGCFGAILRLTGLTALALKSSKDLGPFTRELTQLQQLRSLQLVQLNSNGWPLAPPALHRLPHLEHYSFHHSRGEVMVPGGGMSEVHFLKAGHAGGAVLELGFCHSDPPVESLQRLLDSLLPPGTELTRFKACLMSTSVAALQPCHHLSALQALELQSLRCEEGDEAALAVLLGQARGLTQLEWSGAATEFGGPGLLPQCLVDYGGLLRLALRSQALDELPIGCAFLPTIEALDLKRNMFDRLPPALAAASSLRALQLEDNRELQLCTQEVDRLLGLPALQELDLRGTKTCTWPADLARLARRPGLELRLDAFLYQRNMAYMPDYAFDGEEGCPPWEAERRRQREAEEEAYRQRQSAEGQQQPAVWVQPAVAEQIAALAAAPAQLQALLWQQAPAQGAYATLAAAAGARHAAAVAAASARGGRPGGGSTAGSAALLGWPAAGASPPADGCAAGCAAGPAGPGRATAGPAADAAAAGADGCPDAAAPAAGAWPAGGGVGAFQQQENPPDASSQASSRKMRQERKKWVPLSCACLAYIVVLCTCLHSPMSPAGSVDSKCNRLSDL